MEGKLVIKDPCTIEQAIWSYENPKTGKPEVVFIKCIQPDKLKAIFCDGSWRLGTIDENGKSHLPQDFEQIINFENTPANASLTAPFMYLIAKKDKQWGLVNANNEQQLPFAYDSIYLARKSGANDCMVLMKNGKYGLYFDREHNSEKRYPRQLFEPQFDYQPRTIFHINREKSTADYFLMLLVDEKGNPMGYVDEHGRKFFKD